MIHCYHYDAEFCDKCWPSKKNMKNAISMFLHVSRIGEKIHVAVDVNPVELKEFGVSMEQFQDIGDAIESAVRFVIEPLSDKTLIESKL